MKYIFLLIAIILLTGCNQSGSSNETTVNQPDANVSLSKAALGESLFNDANLSLTRSMSCATCHNPDHAFIDTRENLVNRAVSLGDDALSLGDRNSPTVSYSSFSPAFGVNAAGNFEGGQFFDGRSSNLTEQAKGPFLNSVEMQMPTEASVVQRVQENQTYIKSMKEIYGESVFDDTAVAYNSIADAIAEFENTDTFKPFDSDFDANNLSASAMRGQNLFRSAAINCARCHEDQPTTNLVFTNFTYENIGVPANTAVRALNAHAVDLGLSENPAVNDASRDGKFKVSTLRNIAVTGPYMHNGVFKELKTVVHFYNTRDVVGAINPETNEPWRVAEVNRGLVVNDVGNLGLTDAQEDDIVEFLKALTDSKYKHLIQ